MKYLYVFIFSFVVLNVFGQTNAFKVDVTDIKVDVTDIKVDVADVKTDSCHCYTEIKELTPDQCKEVKESYGTIAYESFRYFTRCELLTYMPKSRPNGWAAYKLSPKENYPGYWVTGYGWFETLSEADQMAINIQKEYPEFCKCYGTVVPTWTIRFKYETTTIPKIGK